MTDGIDFWRILKWGLIVLIAGFIGQFGKTFAKHMMVRIKTGGKGVPSGTEGSGEKIEITGERYLSKIPEDMSPEQVEERAKQEKKALKVQAKQKKKETKLTKNYTKQS